MSVLLWAALALAQEGPAEPATTLPELTAPGAEAEPERDYSYVPEIVVYGDVVVERARAEVVRELQEDGYTQIIERGDTTVYRHPESWKGEVHLHNDGWAIVKRQPVQFHPPGASTARDADPESWIWCVWLPACIDTKGRTVSKRRLTGQKVRVLADVQPKVEVLANRIADRETETRVQDLPERLEQLWLHGTPLEDGPLLETFPERKEAIFQHWTTRADNMWGDRVRVSVEAFIRSEVQYSEHAYTDEELVKLNERRTCGRELDLDTPWSEVISDPSLEPYQ